MRNLLLLILFTFLFSSCTRRIYVVRHAEKAVATGGGSMMSNDPHLSEKGRERAETLKEIMEPKKIGLVYSTNTIRAKSTAEPTRAFFGLDIETYSPIPDDAFFKQVRSTKKNILIVGHSNTVDDIVNKICGETRIAGDLDESQYDNLYVIRKKGKKLIFENKKYGVPTP